MYHPTLYPLWVPVAVLSVNTRVAQLIKFLSIGYAKEAQQCLQSHWKSLWHWSKPAYFLKMYCILRLQTSPLAACEPTAPTEKTIFISIIPFHLPHLKGLFPHKHGPSMTIYILCLQPLTFFRPPSHSDGFSGLSTSSTHGEQYIYGSSCCCSPPQIFTYTKTAAPPTTKLLLPVHR